MYKPQSPAELNHSVQPPSNSNKTMSYTHNPTSHPSPSHLVAPSALLLQCPFPSSLTPQPLNPSKTLRNIPPHNPLSSRTLVFFGPVSLASTICLSSLDPHFLQDESYERDDYTSAMTIKVALEAIMTPILSDCAGAGVVGSAWGERVGHYGCVGVAG